MERWPNLVTVKAQGPQEEDEDDHKQDLLDQLQNARKETQSLIIQTSVPSNTEWDVLGQHFNSVRNLEVDAGFNEGLNDEKIPIHWPLERLLLSSSCGEVFQSPFVVEGRVKHLILLLTAGLRFEGPTTDELSRTHREAIARGEIEPEDITVHEGTPEERKIEVVSIPDLAQNWLRDKYNGENDSQYPPISIPDEIEMETLEIIENDAMDTFTRMCLAFPYIVDNLKTLNIRSALGLDFQMTTKEMFQDQLPYLAAAETFIFTVGEVFDDDEYLPLLIQTFPPGLSTLRFRGPISLMKSEHWTELVDSFANPEYLPNLNELSFVLDLDYEEKEGYFRKTVVRAQEERLREANDACKQLLNGAKSRGITVGPFHDEWAGKENKIFTQVDERWEN